MAFHLALATGMRQGEILGLRWSDIDFDRRLISVRQTLSHDGKELKSGAKTKTIIRTISIDPNTARLLQKHRRVILSEKIHSGSEYKDNDLVVSTSVGTPCSQNLSRIWHDLLKKSELPTITFHDLRHTHASLLLKNNVHPKIVSERLGHSKIQISQSTFIRICSLTCRRRQPTSWQNALFELITTVLPDCYHELESRIFHGSRRPIK